jgi:protein subunit release factor B
MEKPKERIHSVTQGDFRFDFYRGSGNGGQKKNKTSSACRCTHIESGSVACSEEYREQSKNKREAWLKCVKSKKFQVWHKMEICKLIAKLNGEKTLEEQVELLLSPENLKIEIRDYTGRWVILDDTHNTKI